MWLWVLLFLTANQPWVYLGLFPLTSTFSGWCQWAIGLIEVWHPAEQRLKGLCVCWLSAERSHWLPAPGLCLGYQASGLEAWKGYRNPLTAPKAPPHTVPSVSCETLPHFPDTSLTPVLSTSPTEPLHELRGLDTSTPQKFPSAMKKSNPLMTLLPKLPEKLQFKVHVPVQMDVYTLLQAHTCTHNYSGIKQACKLLLFRHQRRGCWFDWKLEESLIKA